MRIWQDISLTRLEDYNLDNISLPTWELIPRLIAKVGLSRLEDFRLSLIW